MTTAIERPVPEREKPFSNDEVRSMQQEPSPTEPDLEDEEIIDENTEEYEEGDDEVDEEDEEDESPQI